MGHLTAVLGPAKLISVLNVKQKRFMPVLECLGVSSRQMLFLLIKFEEKG